MRKGGLARAALHGLYMGNEKGKRILRDELSAYTGCRSAL